MKRLIPFSLALFALTPAHGQQAISRLEGPGAPKVASTTSITPVAPAAPGAPAAPATPAPAVAPAPTWETQKQARTYALAIPAPRGQIVDRNGNPFAQTRVSYNLGIDFPTPLTFTDAQVLAYAQQQVLAARSATGRMITLTQDQVLTHYKNRGVVPLIIAQDLKPPEIENFNRLQPANLSLQAVYQRFYPNGAMAGHIIGYAGRAGRTPDGPMQNNELIWPDAVGREGLEQMFDDQLQGKNGQFNISFDPHGKKTSEQVSIPPQPGYNVVTTLDEDLQRLCESVLEKNCKRGAIVMIDPNNGEILAMASWPTINPNAFIPSISPEAFKALNDDPAIPLFPRAFRSTYPPGSVFKIPVGLAALQEHIVETDDEYSCPPSMEIGNITFRNWKKTGSGSLNFCEALTQSCDTWFYQVGIKTGSVRMATWATKMGFGSRTGIPLNAEANGLIPTDEYMRKVHGRKMLEGDLANFSIGQGDVTVTPLQMAQGMATIANGGTLYQTRLVKQVQSIDGKIVTAYPLRARGDLGIEPKIMKEMRKALSQVVSSPSGTAGKASVPGIQVAGKTGTAETCTNCTVYDAWFIFFAPADNPTVAGAVVVEHSDGGFGGSVAAPIAKDLMQAMLPAASNG
jgi:penicillin-binding protein 2